MDFRIVLSRRGKDLDRGSIAAYVVQDGKAGADLLAHRRIQDLETAKSAIVSMLQKSIYPITQIIFEIRLVEPAMPVEGRRGRKA